MIAGARPLHRPPVAGTLGIVAVRGVRSGGVRGGVFALHALRSGAVVLRVGLRWGDAPGQRASSRGSLPGFGPWTTHARRTTAALPDPASRKSDASPSRRS